MSLKVEFVWPPTWTLLNLSKKVVKLNLMGIPLDGLK